MGGSLTFEGLVALFAVMVAGALVKMDGVPAGGNSVLVYFSCEDCAVEDGRVAPGGGKVYRSRFSVGQHGFITRACDPAGNMIGLHSMK